jgi:magnesium transporter
MHIMQLTNDGQAVSLPISPESWPGLWEKLSLQRDPFWLDLTGAADAAFVESLLLEQFGFHPLAVDDALHETHAPKLDNWESYLYIVLQDVAYQAA